MKSRRRKSLIFSHFSAITGMPCFVKLPLKTKLHNPIVENSEKPPSNTAVVYILPGKSDYEQTKQTKVLRKCGMRLCFDESATIPWTKTRIRGWTGLRDSKGGVILLL